MNKLLKLSLFACACLSTNALAYDVTGSASVATDIVLKDIRPDEIAENGYLKELNVLSGKANLNLDGSGILKVKNNGILNISSVEEEWINSAIKALYNSSEAVINGKNNNLTIHGVLNTGILEFRDFSNKETVRQTIASVEDFKKLADDGFVKNFKNVTLFNSSLNDLDLVNMSDNTVVSLNNSSISNLHNDNDLIKSKLNLEYNSAASNVDGLIDVNVSDSSLSKAYVNSINVSRKTGIFDPSDTTSDKEEEFVQYTNELSNFTTLSKVELNSAKLSGEIHTNIMSTASNDEISFDAFNSSFKDETYPYAHAKVINSAGKMRLVDVDGGDFRNFDDIDAYNIQAKSLKSNSTININKDAFDEFDGVKDILTLEFVAKHFDNRYASNFEQKQSIKDFKRFNESTEQTHYYNAQGELKTADVEDIQRLRSDEETTIDEVDTKNANIANATIKTLNVTGSEDEKANANVILSDISTINAKDANVNLYSTNIQSNSASHATSLNLENSNLNSQNGIGEFVTTKRVYELLDANKKPIYQITNDNELIDLNTGKIIATLSLNTPYKLENGTKISLNSNVYSFDTPMLTIEQIDSKGEKELSVATLGKTLKVEEIYQDYKAISTDNDNHIAFANINAQNSNISIKNQGINGNVFINSNETKSLENKELNLENVKLDGDIFNGNRFASFSTSLKDSVIDGNITTHGTLNSQNSFLLSDKITARKININGYKEDKISKTSINDPIFMSGVDKQRLSDLFNASAMPEDTIEQKQEKTKAYAKSLESLNAQAPDTYKNYSLKELKEMAEKYEMDFRLGTISNDAKLLARDEIRLAGVAQTRYKNSTNTGELQAKNINLIGSNFVGSIIGNDAIDDDLSKNIFVKAMPGAHEGLLNESNFYERTMNVNDKKILNSSTINAKDSVIIGDLFAGNISLENSKHYGRIRTNNLSASNTEFYNGALRNNFTGTMLASTSTSGANNSMNLMGLNIANSTIDASNIANLPLALLKVGDGNANADTFFTQVNAVKGLHKLALPSENIVSGTITRDGEKYIYLAVANANAPKNSAQTPSSVEFRPDAKSGANVGIINFDILQEHKEDLVHSGTQIDVKTFIAEAKKEGIELSVEQAEQIINNQLKDGISDNEFQTQLVLNGQVITADMLKDPKLSKTLGELLKANESTVMATANSDAATVTLDNNYFIDPDLDDSNELKMRKPGLIEALSITPDQKAIDTAKNMLNYAYYSAILEHAGDYERASDLRNGSDFGVYTSANASAAKSNDLHIRHNQISIGADKKIDFANGEIYAGAMLRFANTKGGTDFDAKYNNYTLAAYANYIDANGYFADSLIKYNYQSSSFDDSYLGKHLHTKGAGFGLLVNAGKKFGDEYFVAPSLGFNLEKLPEIKLSGRDNVVIKSDDNMHYMARAAVEFGAKISKNWNASIISGYEFDINNSPSIKLSDDFAAMKIDGEKDKRAFVNLGLKYKLGENAGFDFGAGKSFGAKLNSRYNFDAKIRYNF